MPDSVRTALTQNEQDVYNKTFQAFKGEWGENYIRKHVYRCLDDACRIQGFRQNSRILNVGGAPYMFECFAKSKSLQIDSLDIDVLRHKDYILKLELNAIECDIEDSDARQKLDIARYDVISVCEVLEHMRKDLIGTLEFFRDHMRDDAIIYITTPNFFFAPNFFVRLLTDRSGPSLVAEWSKLKSLGHMGNVREYSKRELVELFRFVGFSVSSISVRNSRPVQVSRTLKGFIPSLVFKILSETFNKFGQEFIFVLTKKKQA